MTQKAIKAKMMELYDRYVNNNDESYLEFYNALYTLWALNMISDSTWEMIKNEDKQLSELY